VELWHRTQSGQTAYQCCIYAMDMSTASALLRQVRIAAGLSCTALAARAGVPTSTVSRIESDAMDPTVSMLARVMAAAGCRLELSSQTIAPAPRLTDLSGTRSHDVPDWAGLRAMVEWAVQHPDRVTEMIADRPDHGSSPMRSALLASVADKLADDQGLRRPPWAASVPPVDRPWTPPGTPTMIAKARRNTPAQLRARNIFLAEHDLWP
jgi:transcriptional regulator with XRE-family HTH domain